MKLKSNPLNPRILATTRKLQDKINRLLQSGSALLTTREQRSLISAGLAAWVSSPTPDHRTRKLLRATEKCPGFLDLD